MFLISYTFKGQVHVFAGQVKIVSHSSCRTSTILKYFCPLQSLLCYVSYSLQGDQTRQVRHFHFTAWPDFGVPKKPQSLVRFVRTVRAKLFKDGGPILTHCRYESFL